MRGWTGYEGIAGHLHCRGFSTAAGAVLKNTAGAVFFLIVEKALAGFFDKGNVRKTSEKSLRAFLRGLPAVLLRARPVGAHACKT